MKKLTCLLLCLFVGIGLVSAQTDRVTGTVISAEDGEPLAGVTVKVKGTTIGTQTDIMGAFTLTNIPEGATTLVISYIGMQTLEVAIRPTLSIELQTDTQLLEEVVVTAFGISREKKALGYATQEVKSEMLSMTGNTDLTKALQGKVAGVDLKNSSGMPGASSQIVIRGARSFDGDNTPLFIVDGMPVASTSYYGTGYSVTGSDISNRAVDIDPNDIESINILKGQAAAALYGLRASNGAVIITTKSGKGKVIGRTNVSISQTTSFDRVSRTPEYQTTWAQGMNGNFDPNGSSAWGRRIVDLPDDPTWGGNSKGHPGKYQVNQLILGGYGEEDTWVTPQIYDNWNDYYRTGVQSTTSVLISRAENTGNFAIGLSYTDQTGIALNTGMKKWNAKANADKKLNDHFTAGFTANFMKNDINKLTGANDGSVMGVLAAPANYNLKGIPYHRPGAPYTQIFYRGGTFDNPYWIEHNNSFTENTNRFFGNFYLQYDTQLAEGHKLSVKYQLGTDTYTSHYQDIFGYGHSGNLGYLENYGVTEYIYNSLLTANYDWKITDDFDLNLIVGNELNHTHSKTYYQAGYDFNFGGWNHINNTSDQEADESQWQERTVGFFGSLSLSYLNMLYLNATARQDVASIMPPENRRFFYPSVSLSFVFSELAPLKELTWLSLGKIKGSYAEVGNASRRYIENYYRAPGYGGGFWSGAPITYPLDGVNSYTKSTTLYDPNLKPQNTKSWEIGFQLNFLKNRIGIDYTYVNQNTVDQIFPVPLPGSANGGGSLITNGGQMKTTQHEVILNVTPVLLKDFRWDVNVNFSQMVNTCVSLREGVESIMLGGFVEPQVRAGVNATYPIIYGNTFAKDKEGRILVDENPNSVTYGMPMAGEPGPLGQVAPDFILGGGTNLTYKEFSLGVVFEWKNGGHMYSGVNGLMDLYGISKRTEDRESTFIYKGYKADGTPNDIVRGGPNDKLAYQYLYNTVLGNISEGYIYGNSFIKLREISLRYALPKSLLPKMDIAVSAFARNILLWTELPNADPESSQGNNNMMGAFERFSLPQTKSFGFSVNVNF